MNVTLSPFIYGKWYYKSHLKTELTFLRYKRDPSSRGTAHVRNETGIGLTGIVQVIYFTPVKFPFSLLRFNLIQFARRELRENLCHPSDIDESLKQPGIKDSKFRYITILENLECVFTPST